MFYYHCLNNYSSLITEKSYTDIMKTKSILSRKREEKRNSQQTKDFRKKIINFLETTRADNEIVYSIKRDLSKKTDMEFYKQKKKIVKIKRQNIEIVKEYVRLLIEYNDLDFAKRLIKKLSVQQDQALRKIALRSEIDQEKAKVYGNENGIWDHVIPVKVVVSEIVNMIKNNDASEIDKLLNIYCKAGQRFITKDIDNLLKNKYKACMPENWDWRNNKSDPLARYKALNISNRKLKEAFGIKTFKK